MSGGMGPKRKGYCYENELRLEFVDCGLGCRRVPLSGAGEEKDDLVLTTGWDQKLRIEAKRRKSLPSYLAAPLDKCDVTIFRQDRGKSLVLISLELFKELCQ